MLESSTIESIADSDERRVCKQALATLASYGVFALQESVERERLLQGDSEESLDLVAEKIVRYRRVSQNLQTLHQLGEQYQRELQL